VRVSNEDPCDDAYGAWTEATGFLRLLAQISVQIQIRGRSAAGARRSKLSVIREAGHLCEVKDRFDESVSGGAAADQNG
jgi:hypothetical protein